MRQKLDSTDIKVQDAQDQPQGPRYILFLAGALGERAALVVDGVREKDAVMEAWVEPDHVIVAKWNPTVLWVLVARERLEIFSVREWMRRLMKDGEQGKAFLKELFPAGDNGEGMAVMDSGDLAQMIKSHSGSGQGYL